MECSAHMFRGGRITPPGNACNASSAQTIYSPARSVTAPCSSCRARRGMPHRNTVPRRTPKHDERTNNRGSDKRERSA